MRAFVKAALMAGVAWSTTATLAMAQDQTPPSDKDEAASVEEVVVTARRREETLKDVPISVSALSSEKLERAGAADITNLQQSTPNATVAVARGSNSTLVTFLRGVGQQDPLWGFDAGVGLYVDDVYLARPQGAVLDIYDVSRIEVLRGPQGTLYGRNTIGGAIKYVTNKIGNEPEVKVRGTFGSYNEQDYLLAAKAPITSTLGASLTVAKYDHDGWGHNITTGAENYNKDVFAARGSLEFTPAENLFFRLSGDYVKDDSNAREGHREFTPILPGKYDTAAGSPSANEVINKGVSLLGQWTISDELTAKSITAYRSGETHGVIDFDSLPQLYLDVPAEYGDHQFSQEFQLVINKDKLQGVVGAFYLSSTARGAFDTTLVNANLTILTLGYVDTESLSFFGDFSYDITDQLQVSVGGRWTHDEKEGHVFRQNFTGLHSPYFGNAAAVPGLVRSNYTNSKTFEQFTPRVSVSYKFTPELTGYASYSQGFKSGGFDMRGDVVLYPATVDGYEPETVDSYEAGLKGSLADNRISFATDVFLAKYKDQQITTQYPSGATVASVVDNAGKSTIKGWEFEGSAILTDNLTANVALGYLDAQFDEFIAYVPGTGYVDVSNTRDFQNAPKWTANYSLTYRHDFGDAGRISFTPTASYRADYQVFEAKIPLLDQKAFWLYDATLLWHSPSDKYQVGITGKNLQDTRYRVGGYNFPGALYGNSITGFYGAPRTVLVTLQATF